MKPIKWLGNYWVLQEENNEFLRRVERTIRKKKSQAANPTWENLDPKLRVQIMISKGVMTSGVGRQKSVETLTKNAAENFLMHECFDCMHVCVLRACLQGLKESIRSPEAGVKSVF